jgi:hypothetical protein
MFIDPSGNFTLAEQLTVVAVIGTVARIATPRIVKGLLGEEDYNQLSECVNSFIEQYYTIEGFNTVEIADSFAFLNTGLAISATSADLGIGWVIRHQIEFINSPGFLDWLGVDKKAIRSLPRTLRMKMMNSFRQGPLVRLKAAQKILGKVEIGTAAVALTGQVFVGSAYSIATAACLLED